MADKFRRLLDYHCGIGGVHCYCCNYWKGSHKPKLRRMARRTLKDEVRKEIDDRRIEVPS